MATGIITQQCKTYQQTVGSGSSAVTWDIVELGNFVIMRAHQAFVTSTWTTQGGNITSDMKTMTLPFAISDGSAYGSCTPHYTWLANTQVNSGTTVTFRILRSAASASEATETAHVLVTGWKS